jgi:hypothetical protein
MKSSYEFTKQRSEYHFDKWTNDLRWDTLVGLGRITGDWDQELERAIANAKPGTWETRGYKGEGTPSPDIEAEEYDLINAGANPKMLIGDFVWKMEPIFQKITDLFCLEDPYPRIHIQKTGEVFNMHIDKLEKWDPENPHNVFRAVLHLNDWELGQWWQSGNYTHTKWRRGDMFTFDWWNIPHGTANASLLPRCTLLITGKGTPQTYEFLKHLRTVPEYKV